MAGQLLRALHRRLDSLTERTEAALGAATVGQAAYRRALEVLRQYPESVRQIVETERADSGDEDLQPFVQVLLRHALNVVAFAQTWVFGAESMQDEPALLAMVREECECLGLGLREPIIVPGDPSNFLTFPRDLEEVLFGGLRQLGYTFELPEGAPRFVLLQTPYFEGRRSPWYPIVLGHELAHLAVEDRDVVRDLPVSQAIGLDDGLPSDIKDTPEARVEFLRMAESWVRELLCDAYMVRRFGPAAVCAMGEFFAAVGAAHAHSDTHPPGSFRLALQLRWLGEIPDDFAAALEPWRELSTEGRTLSPREQRLCDAFDGIADEIRQRVEWASGYDVSERIAAVREVAGLLRAGSPAAERAHLEPGPEPVQDADVLCASWLALVDGPDDPTERLTAKSLDTLVFVRQWQRAGGDVLELPVPDASDMSEEGPGVLSQNDLYSRLQRPRDGGGRLGVTPLLAGAVGAAGIDVRLSNRFIVFQRTSVSSFDPLSTTDDPRAVQREVTRAWGEAFVLHPGELVLAATLEYLTMPADLTAQVITRSSYGRLGLITATAVQVNPWFRGCLTLELVNLGDVPLELTPGERIAQLVFQSVRPLDRPLSRKYDCSTGPQFSQVRTDRDAEVLRRLRPEGNR